MSTHIFIGCDIGTSGTKAVAVDISGTILSQSAQTYNILKPHSGWAEQNPDIWLDAAIYTIQSVIQKLPSHAKVEAICISALYGGTGVLCDEQMNSIRPAIIWMDRRSEAEGQEISDTIGKERIFQISGNGTDSYFGYTKLLWIKKNEPDNWARIRHILPIHSYIIYKMTGQITVDYCSAGNLGGIYDYSAHTWSKEMCRQMGIPFETLPQNLHTPTDIAGSLNEEYQKKLGLDISVPLCVGTVDCLASMLSAGAIRPGDNAAVLGTSLNWGFIHSNIPDNPALISMPYCIDPTHYSYTYGGSSTAGALPRWFAGNFMGNETADAFNELEHCIKSQNIGPGADGLIALPYFMGERTPIWDEKATGVLFGLTLSHTKAHIYRAILESVAYSLRHIMESMTDSDTAVRKIVLVGGGARSPLWRQIFADVTGLPVITPVQEIEAPLGDAFMAAIGSGFIKNPSVIDSWITMNPPVTPNVAAHGQYEKYFSLYKELYPTLKESMLKRNDLLK